MNADSRDGQSSGGHIPVMAAEAIDGLALRAGDAYVDGTFGGGGHARLIAERIEPDGRLICIDRDPSVLNKFNRLKADFPDMVEFVHGSYAGLGQDLAELGIAGADGILLDLGLSSLQLENSERGFSFIGDGPLDMRFDRSSGRTAADLINTIDERDLVDLLFKYGEERAARRIARAIVRARNRGRVETTRQLADLIEATAGRRPGSRIHPATRTFQALRIGVNEELDELERGLRSGIDTLLPGGRFVVIAFHSLEDRVVKQTFKEEVRGCVCPPGLPVCVCGRSPRLKLVGKPVKPSTAEVQANPRARSAIMRVAERLS